MQAAPQSVLHMSIGMSKIVVVDNEYITIECFPEEGLVAHTFHKALSGQPFRDALDAGTEALIEHGCYKWLSDDRSNGPLDSEDLEWAFNDWNIRTIDAGWKYWGIVVPTDMVSAVSMTRQIMDVNEKGLEVKVADNLEEILEWLDRF